MSDKPKFDPSKPFEAAPQAAKPPFNPAAPVEAVADAVEDVAHPDISPIDRLAIKNLGNNSGAAYLQQQLGSDYEVKDQGGEVLVKKKGEKSFKKLDPGLHKPTSVDDLLGLVKETMQDVSDVGSDVVSGVAEAGAGAFGGAQGFARGGPAAAIPGAMAAAGSAGGAVETLRQGLGMSAGVNPEMDWGQVGIAAGAGAGGAALLGGGAVTEQLVKAGMKRGFTGKALEDFVKAGVEANRGAVSRTASAVGNTVGAPLVELLSGVDADIVRTGAKRIGEITETSKEGIGQTVLSVKDDAKKLVSGARKEAGQEISEILQRTDAKIDLSTAENTIKKALQDPDITPDQVASLQNALGVISKNFPDEKVASMEVFNPLTGRFTPSQTEQITRPASREVSAKKAWNIMKTLDDLGQVSSTKEFGSRFGQGVSVADKQAANVAAEGANTIRSQLNEATGGLFGKANEKFSEAAKDEAVLAKFFNDDTGQRGYQRLSNVFSDANKPTLERLAQIDESYGTQLVPAADFVAAYKTYDKPSFFPTSSKGTTSTSRSKALEGITEAVPNRTARAAIRTMIQPLVGPAMQKKAFQTIEFLRRGGVPNAVPFSAWNMLDVGEQ